MPNFLRRNWSRHLKFSRKKKRAWRRAAGIDNKIREKRRGYPAGVRIGYRNKGDLRGKINSKKPVQIFNSNDLLKLRKDEIGVVGSVGIKKKIIIAKKAHEMGIELANINIKKFLKNKTGAKK